MFFEFIPLIEFEQREQATFKRETSRHKPGRMQVYVSAKFNL